MNKKGKKNRLESVNKIKKEKKTEMTCYEGQQKVQ